MPLRREMLDSFEPAMLPVGCLDRYALMGSIAGWWDEIRYELRVIVENGFAELVDGWVETLRSALEDEDADDDEDSDAKKTVKVTLEELLAHPFVRHRMADYVTELSAAQAEVERIKAEKEAWETGDGVEGAEDWLDGAEEGSNLAKELEKRRKELRAEMKDDDKRRKELVKTTGTGKPSKGSIDWMRAQGMDVREFEAELAAIERRLAPLVEEAETIDAMLAPYEAIKEELKEARATLRRLKAAFVERLTAARAELDDDDCRELVLDIDRERLLDRLERARVRRVGALVADLERLWDKYRVSLKKIEGPQVRRDDAARRLPEGAQVCLIRQALRFALSNPDTDTQWRGGRSASCLHPDRRSCRRRRVIDSSENGPLSTTVRRGYTLVQRWRRDRRQVTPGFERQEGRAAVGP